MEMSEKKTETDTSLYSQNGAMRGFAVYNSEGDTYYKGEVEKMVRELRQELYPPKAVSMMPQGRPMPERPLYRKKKAPLVFIFIFNLIALAVLVLSCIDLGSIGGYIGTFNKVPENGPAVTVSFFDGLFAELHRIDALSFLPARLNYSVNEDTLSKVFLIAFAALGTLTALLTLIQLFKALVVLGRRRDRKKAHFGGLAFITLLTTLLTVLSLAALKGQFGSVELGMGDFCSLIFVPELEKVGLSCGLPRAAEGYTLYSGYGLYALILIPILTSICSACIYQKRKV